MDAEAAPGVTRDTDARLVIGAEERPQGRAEGSGGHGSIFDGLGGAMDSAQLRGEILKAAYAEWRRTGAFHAIVRSAPLAERLGEPPTEVYREVQFLHHKGLVKDLASGQAFIPTAEGVEYVEQPPRSQPEGMPVVFAAGGDIRIVGSQISSVGSFQSSVIGWAPAEVLSVIAELRKAVPNDNSDPSLCAQLHADLNALEAQCRRPTRNEGLIRDLWGVLNTTVQSAASLVQLAPLLMQLGRMLGI